MNSNKKKFKNGIENVRPHIVQFLMGTYLLEIKRWCFDWHIFLKDEELMFRLTHTSWRWIGGVSINTYLLIVNRWSLDWHIIFGCEQVSFILFFVHLFSFFIHFILLFVLIFHPCTCGRLFLHLTNYFVPCVNIIF